VRDPETAPVRYWFLFAAKGMCMQDVTVVFDLDGTLADTSPDLCGALQAVMAPLGIAVELSEMRHLVGRGARVMIERAFTRYGKPQPEREVMDGLVAEYFDYYVAHIADSSFAFPGVEAELIRLTECGARLAVCTNKREDAARLLLGKLDMTRHFRAILGGDTLPVQKPDPAHLFGAIAAAGGSPERAVMIGDSIVDIETARAANVPSVAVSFGFSDVPATSLGAGIVIDHYSELPGALKTVLSSR
jgi:phosphoglycolate phosphatase